jgi:hypothetical protein
MRRCDLHSRLMSSLLYLSYRWTDKAYGMISEINSMESPYRGSVLKCRG